MQKTMRAGEIHRILRGWRAKVPNAVRFSLEYSLKTVREGEIQTIIRRVAFK